MSLFVGELREKVFVDAPEDIARDLFQFVGVERAEELAEYVVVQFLVFAFGQCTPQAFVVVFNGFHCFDDGFDAVFAVGQGDEVVELRVGPEVDGVFLGEVLFGECSFFTASGGQVGFNVVLYR